MKKTAIFVLVFAGFLGGIVFVYSCGGGGGGGSGGSTASAAAANVGTAISSVPYTISASGLYYLSSNLSPPSGVADGIIVNADDVTIDLMGFVLDGNNSTSAGIYMSGRSNVEIRNGTVRKFEHGIHEDNGGSGFGHRIFNVRAWANTTNGIFLLGTGHMVKDSTASGNGGLGISGGTGATVSGNTAFANSTNGINAGTGSTVIGNTTYGNTNTGIGVSSGSTVIGNTAYNNGGNGIQTTGWSTIRGNTSASNTGSGITLSGDSLVTGNTSANNGTDAFSCSTCTFGINEP